MSRLHRWRKLGCLYAPVAGPEWLQSHAANPVAEHVTGDLFRVYFSPRDAANRSQICCLLLELGSTGPRVLEGSVEHVLGHGRNGRFDDSGVTVTGILRSGSSRLLYYLGWNRAVTIPFRNAVGVAVAEGDGQAFRRRSEAPLVDRSDVDPISLSYPFVLRDDGQYRVWYGSCVEWRGSTVADYEFALKYAESADGLHWQRTGEVAVACDYPREDAIARPHVIREDGGYRMWYSRKKGPDYRIGYAESDDGRHWVRRDDLAGIDVSGHGWDSEMVEYPFVFDHGGQRYMLYNGNGYGKSGFGLAVAE